MEIKELLSKEAMGILETSMVALTKANLQPYKQSPQEENRKRFLKLIHLIIDAVDEKTLVPIQEYAVRVAKERHKNGFCLREVFTAFNVLEEALWKCIIEHTSTAEHAKHLGLVSTILSRGKESLALAYMDLVVEDPNPVRDLSALASGHY